MTLHISGKLSITFHLSPIQKRQVGQWGSVEGEEGGEEKTERGQEGEK